MNLLLYSPLIYIITQNGPPQKIGGKWQIWLWEPGLFIGKPNRFIERSGGKSISPYWWNCPHMLSEGSPISAHGVVNPPKKPGLVDGQFLSMNLAYFFSMGRGPKERWKEVGNSLSKRSFLIEPSNLNLEMKEWKVAYKGCVWGRASALK